MPGLAAARDGTISGAAKRPVEPQWCLPAGEESVAAMAAARRRKLACKEIAPACRILLQSRFDAIMCRSPNFARACGRVSIGRHPDKRPDSRLRLDLQPHYVIGSRRRNRRTPRSTGDAA